MRGVVFSGTLSNGNSFPKDAFPSISFGSGTIQKEDLYRYNKRNAQGEMRRIGYVGYVIRIECKWALLTREQYETLMDYITQMFFEVKFQWQGSQITKEFYAGNSSATPYMLIRHDDEDVGTNYANEGKPRYYRDVSFPIICKETLTI